ncbi:MAG: hypothetical protein J5680_00670 [Neisseriaceae bacterium]|nr:hypothetical protein [Neisseriaceae bacterium]
MKLFDDNKFPYLSFLPFCPFQTAMKGDFFKYRRRVGFQPTATAKALLVGWVFDPP